MPTVASRISENLLAASEDSFSSSLALIRELSLFNLIWSKGEDLFEKVDNRINKGIWSRNVNHFQESVVAKSKEFATLPRGERLLTALGELQRLMAVAPRDLRTPFDLAEVADDICLAAVRILRDDQKSDFAGNDVGAMIEYQMTKIFGGLNIRMEDLSSVQQQGLVDSVREFLQSLPTDKQRFILDKLGAVDLSESVIRRAIASGAMWTAFAAAVEVFGFAFYTTAAHLLAIVSLHLLPFSAYLGLSSTVAVLSSAWMLPIFAGLGIWYYSRKNKGLRQSMAPLIVTSLCLSGMEVQARSSAHRESAVDDALSLWRTARTTRDQERSATANAISVHNRVRVRLATTRNELAQAHARKVKIAGERYASEQELKLLVISDTGAIAQGRWGRPLTNAASKIQDTEVEVNNARQKRDRKCGALEKILAYAEYASDAFKFIGHLSSAKDALFEQVKLRWPKDGTAYPANAASLLRAMEEKTSAIVAAEADITRLTAQERDDSTKFDRSSAELRTAQDGQKMSEQRYYGLGAV